MFPASGVSCAREKFGDQSTSRQRALLAIERPPGFELVATLAFSAFKSMVSPFIANVKRFHKLDSDNDVIWAYVKEDEKDDLQIQVPDARVKVGCIHCMRELDISFDKKTGQTCGLARIQFGSPDDLKRCVIIPLYWRACSHECALSFQQSLREGC